MYLKLTNLFLIILIALVALVGCEKAQRMVVDGVPADNTMDETMTDMEAVPVKFVLLIDYPKMPILHGLHPLYQPCKHPKRSSG